MAINQCFECSGRVSTKAPRCPHCGAPVDQPHVPSSMATEAEVPEIVAANAPLQWVAGKPIPEHFYSIIAQQLSAGVSIETSVQQLIAAGYHSEDALRSVQTVSASRGTSLQLTPGSSSIGFTVMRIVAIVFCGFWSLLGVLLYFQISNMRAMGPTPLVFIAAITAFALLTGVFLALRKDGAAEACCLLPGILTVPLGIVLILVVKLATKKRSVPS